MKLHNTFISPYFNYCIEVWGYANKKQLKPVIKIQKKIVRILTNGKYNQTSEEMFNKLRILPFEKLVHYRTGCLMYKIQNGLAPTCTKEMFITNEQNHTHNTRNRHHIHLSRGKHEFVYKTFQYQGAHTWNLLLKNKLDIYVSFTKFKKTLKSFFISNCYNHRYSN